MTTLIRCVDVETTGIDPAVHRVCEIATVDVIISKNKLPDMESGGSVIKDNALMTVERGAMWSSIINPGIPIPPEASGIHDITDEMVKDAPSSGDVLMHIAAMDPPDYYCAHNSRFDSKFFMPEDAVWLDTYRIALWLWPSAPEHKLATLRYWLKLKLESFRDALDAVVMAYGREYLPLRRGHLAILDAYICAAVLRRAFMAGATIEQMVEVSSQPALLPKFYFGKNAGVPIEKIDGGYLDWIMSQRGMDEDVTHTAFTELQRRRNLERLQSS